MNSRQELIKKIGEERKTNVITYITADRGNITAQMEPDDIRVFKDHLDKFSEKKDIDLFIFSNGGVTTTAWALINLLREYTDKLTVIIPYKAFSCATSVAIGADEIIMSRIGILGPIDPSVANIFNPKVDGQIAQISVEDVSAYNRLARDIFKINNSNKIAGVFDKLSTDIRPLALGNAYRHYIKARDDAQKLLSLHTKGILNKFRNKKIVSTLVEKLYFHGHHINRGEAKAIGLNIIEPNSNLETLIWSLYLEYEKEMQFRSPYKDEPTTSRDIPIVYIESINETNKRIIRQKISLVNTPQNSFITIFNGLASFFVNNNSFIPVKTEGNAVIINGQIYDKVESVLWL